MDRYTSQDMMRKKTKGRDQLKADVEEFLARGGEIAEIGQGATSFAVVSLNSPVGKARTIENTLKKKRHQRLPATKA